METLDLVLKIIVSVLAIYSSISGWILKKKVVELEKTIVTIKSEKVQGKKNKTIKAGNNSQNIIGNDNSIKKGGK
ncbi:MAG: hypothetical protein M3Z48_00885 [Lactobacillus sp.]|uniref:hypothetical protein n=1 Tax=Bacillus cereus group TaxID=86661 RepID=UPI000977B0A6|nr:MULTISPECIES: hypothetical protein [Bacillus cereus group]MCT6901769.1 hypothetical protein [Lactobacillus sp.]MDA2192301.1 hypothetical protein [Bacillus cereus group sp. Bc238]MDA2197358.1 hypothetical protein [Bacillus cereus group sp. Bc237]MDA2377108.1 hypothetical protein [Bacillus cereus]ONG76028.1 hypothetical protein BKK44_00010 [Bacillus cereus]